MPPAYQVYVLQNAAGRFYIGLSDNPGRRLHQHNSGESTWTSGGIPWQIAWESERLRLREARKLENLLKRQKGGDGFFRLTGLRREPRGS